MVKKVKRAQRKKNGAKTVTTTKKVVTRSRPKRNGMARSGGPSPCAVNYLKVLENPFTGQVSCVPTLVNFPTMKHSVRAQGTFVTSSDTGFGFCSFAPWSMIFNNGAGGLNSIYTSESTYLGIVFATSGTGVLQYGSNSPYINTMTRQQISGRLVAAGLRVRNITPRLYAGGQLIGLESLAHSNLTGLNISDALLQDTCSRLPAGDTAWKSVVWHPQDDDEFDFLGADEFGALQTVILGFGAQAPPVPDGTQAQIYEFEAVACFEALGSLVHGLSPSPADPLGLAAVRNSTSGVGDRKPKSGPSRSEWVGSLLGKLGRVAYDMGSGFISGASPSPHQLWLEGVD